MYKNRSIERFPINIENKKYYFYNKKLHHFQIRNYGIIIKNNT